MGGQQFAGVGGGGIAQAFELVGTQVGQVAKALQLQVLFQQRAQRIRGLDAHLKGQGCAGLAFRIRVVRAG